MVKHFPVRGDIPLLAKSVHALDGISFSLGANGSIGIVGESGSGKTTLARCIMKLERPTSGDVALEGESIYRRLGAKALRRRVQMVFQDPGGSLNPRFPADRILKEALLHLRATKRQRTRDAIRTLLRQVGIRESDIRKLPHQFSGGQQQRIAIARALAPNPDILILDEPTSALDLSLQAQIIALLDSIRRELTLAYVLITHDLSVVRQLCDQLLVMYLGKPVEAGPTPLVLSRPSHPYSRALIGSILRPDPTTRDLSAPLHGEIPSPTAPPPGCRFHPRCPKCMPVCRSVEPRPETVGDATAWCHLFSDSADAPASPQEV
ncbi:oligopeptide/dipeptide ABC transporter ATP-binding protein [Candidatus Bipolaricaulota bacterium]